MAITARWDITPEYLRETYDAVWEARRTKQIILGSVLGLLISLFVIFSIEVLGFHVADLLYVVAVIYILYGAYLLFYRRSWSRRNAEDYSNDRRREALFSEAGVSVSGRLGQTQYSWEAFKRVVPTKRGLVLFLRGETFIYVPDRAIIPSATKDDILSLHQRAKMTNAAIGSVA